MRFALVDVMVICVYVCFLEVDGKVLKEPMAITPLISYEIDFSIDRSWGALARNQVL